MKLCRQTALNVPTLIGVLETVGFPFEEQTLIALTLLFLLWWHEFCTAELTEKFDVRQSVNGSSDYRAEASVIDCLC